jgi:hypothetical protein
MVRAVLAVAVIVASLTHALLDHSGSPRQWWFETVSTRSANRSASTSTSWRRTADRHVGARRGCSVLRVALTRAGTQGQRPAQRRVIRSKDCAVPGTSGVRRGTGDREPGPAGVLIGDEGRQSSAVRPRRSRRCTCGAGATTRRDRGRRGVAHCSKPVPDRRVEDVRQVPTNGTSWAEAKPPAEHGLSGVEEVLPLHVASAWPSLG